MDRIFAIDAGKRIDAAVCSTLPLLEIPASGRYLFMAVLELLFLLGHSPCCHYDYDGNDHYPEIEHRI